MSDLTDDILSNIDIVDIVWKYVNLKRVGKNFSWLCPFHREKTPSFTVAPDKQIYKCFGCGAWWNAIKFIMDIERIEFWEAIKILSKNANIDISKYKLNDEKLEKNVTEKEKIKLMNKYTLNFFKENLDKSPVASKYVKELRKLDKAIIDTFWIWYATSNHYDLIKLLKEKWFNDDDIIKAWLWKKWNSQDTYSFFRDRIMFPIFDHMGNNVAFAGRSIDPKDMPKYLNTTETLVYDKSKVLYWLNIAKNYMKEYDKLIVVEWYMDVIALYRAWLPIWIASCGTALTQNHINLAKRYTQNIIFSFDSDDAGIQATIRWLKIAYENDIFPQIIRVPKWFKDLDELVNANSKDEILNIIDQNTIDWFDHISQILTASSDIRSPIKRKQLISDLFDIINSIKDHSISDFYLEKIANKLNINYYILRGQFDVYRKTNKNYVKKPEAKAKEAINEKYLLWCLFLDNFISTSALESEKNKKLIENLIKISSYFESSLINKIISNEITDEEKQQLLQGQLWWEKQLDTMKQDKKILEIENFLKRQLHKFNQLLSKSSNISIEDKMNIQKNIQALT